MRRLLVVLALATAAHAQTCVPSATQAAALQALRLQKQLVSASVPDMDTDIPAPMRPVLHNYKQALIQTVDTALRCNNPEPAQLERNFAQLL